MSKRTKAAVLALLVNAGSAASQHAEPIQSYDSYQSWFVVCDNTLSRVAKGFDDTSGGAEIRIEREARASGALVASISSVASFVPHDIKIDGAPGGLHGAEWKYTSSQGGSSLRSNDFATVRTLVHQLRDASKVTMGEATVPLNGFSAAVLRLDDRQGRIGGEIALVRADQKAVFVKEECGDTQQQPEAYALDQAQALVLIPCIMGAYQGSSLAFIAQRGSGQAQRLIAPTQRMLRKAVSMPNEACLVWLRRDVGLPIVAC